MSEPSTNIPAEVADTQVDQQPEESTADPAEGKVELDLDEDKLEAWDAVKGDYRVDPDAED